LDFIKESSFSCFIIFHIFKNNLKKIYHSKYRKTEKGFSLNLTIKGKIINKKFINIGGGLVVKVWDQEVCSLCGLRFEPCGCSYVGHWRLTWSLTSGPVGLVEVRASWPGHLH